MKPKKYSNRKINNLGDDFFSIWTDGSFRPPDASAYAYLIFSQKDQHVKHMAKVAKRGHTNNQMELLAIDAALAAMPMKHVVIHTDSAYAIGCLSMWHYGWRRNNWLDSKGEPVKNREIIEGILEKINKVTSLSFVKVKAHSGEQFNSVVDHMCQELTARMIADVSMEDGRW